MAAVVTAKTFTVTGGLGDGTTETYTLNENFAKPPTLIRVIATKEDDTAWSWGYYDGTNQYCCGFKYLAPATTLSGNRWTANNALVKLDLNNNGAHDAIGRISSLGNGTVTIEWTDAPANDLLIQIKAWYLDGSYQISTGFITPPSSGGTVDTDIGFSLDHAELVSTNVTAGLYSTNQSANDGFHFSVGMADQSGSGNLHIGGVEGLTEPKDKQYGRISSDYVVGYNYGSPNSSLSTRLSISYPSTNVFRLTRDAGGGTLNSSSILYCAIKYDTTRNTSALVDNTGWNPSATGSLAITGLGFRPTYIERIYLPADSTGSISSNGKAEGVWVLTASDHSTDEGSCIGFWSDTTNTSTFQMRAHAATQWCDIKKYTAAGGETDFLVSTVTSFDADGYTENITAENNTDPELNMFHAVGLDTSTPPPGYDYRRKRIC